MSSSPNGRATSRRVAPLAAFMILMGCASVPSEQFERRPAPDKVTAVLLTRLNAEQEAAVLDGIAPVLPTLLKRVWGVPPAGTPWRLEVMMSPWRLTPEGRLNLWIDEPTDATTRRDRVRYAFRRAMEESLLPPAPSRAWYVGTMRGVSVQQARLSGDTVTVLVDVSAGMRCADGRNVLHAMAYDVTLIRQPGNGLLLAEQPPRWVTESAGAQGLPADPSCTPTPLLGARD